MGWEYSSVEVLVIQADPEKRTDRFSRGVETEPPEQRAVKLQADSVRSETGSQTGGVLMAQAETQIRQLSEECVSRVIEGLQENSRYDTQIEALLAPSWDSDMSPGVREIRTIQGFSEVTAITWSERGTLAVGFGNSAFLGFAGSGKIGIFRGSSKPTERETSSYVTALAFKPGSELLAVGSAFGDVFSLNVETGEMILGVAAHCEPVTALRWRKETDALLLASLSGEGRIQFWNFPQLTIIASVPLLGPGKRLLTARCLDFFQRELAIACESGQAARAADFTDLTKPPRLQEIEAAPGVASAIRFSPCGHTLALTGGRELKLFSNEQKPYAVFSLSDDVRDFAWSPRPGVFAVAVKSGCYLFDMAREKRKHILRIDSDSSALTFSATGDLAIGSSTGKISIFRL